MKRLFVLFMVLLMAGTIFAQTRNAVITGARTGTDPGLVANFEVTHIDVQVSAPIIEPADWSALLDDFFVMDPNTFTWFGVTGVDTGDAADDQYFRVYLDFDTYVYQPGETGLKFKYIGPVSGPAIVTTIGNLQPTYSDILVADGINPEVIDIIGVSSNLNTTLAVDGNDVIIDFYTSELITNTPAPRVWIFSTNEIEADTVIKQEDKHWRATFLNIQGDHEEGLIDVKIRLSDLSVNTTNHFEADIIDVIYKNTKPDIAYVSTPFTSQANVKIVFPDQIWLWDAFETIQEGVDGVAENGTVKVLEDTYFENVVIDKTITLINYSDLSDAVHYPTIDGGGSGIVVMITADNVRVEGFTIKNSGQTNPDAEAGIVAYRAGEDITGITIYDNYIIQNATGIGIIRGTNCTIEYNGIMNNLYGVGIAKETEANPSTNNNILDCEISNNTVGVYVDKYCSGNLIQDNLISNNSEDGIYLWATQSNTVIENDILNNTVNGIHVAWGSGHVIEDNDIAQNGTGIHFRKRIYTGNTVQNNIINANTAGIIFDDFEAGGETELVMADYNFWGGYTGPFNATYNPQGEYNSVTDNVIFSHWWTSAIPTDYGLIEGSSEIAIQHAIDNSTVIISNVVSNTDGTISMDVTMDYPETWDANLPHELLTDARITSDVAFNDEAYIKIEGWGQTFDNIDVDGTEAWLSDLLLAANPATPVRNPLYLDSDFTVTITFYDLDELAREIGVHAITARDGNFAHDGTYGTTADCVYNNDYRGINDGDGYLLGSDSVSLQDPIQYVLDNSLFYYNEDLDIDIFDVLSFSFTAEYPAAPTTPALSANWLWDIHFQITDDIGNPTDLPIGTLIEWIEGDVWITTGAYPENGSFWLSEIMAENWLTYTSRSALVNELGANRTFTFTFYGLDDSIYNLQATLKTAADGNFTTDISGTEYTIGQDDFDFQDPIQVAINNTDVIIENLVNTTDGTVVFDVVVDYPDWTAIPELPDGLLVDAVIFDAYNDILYQPLPAGVEIVVSYNGNFVDTYTTNGTQTVYLSEIIDTPNRPPLKNDVDGVWTLEISNLDNEIHNLTFGPIAAADGYFVPLTDGSDPYYALGWEVSNPGTAADISFQDPLQVALGTTLEISNLACNVQDEISLHIQTIWPVLTDIPTPDDGWMVDAWIETSPVLPDGTTIQIGAWGTKVMNGSDNGFWTSSILPGTTLNAHNDYTEDLDITVTGLDDGVYNVIVWTVTAATGNFDESVLGITVPETYYNSQFQNSQNQYALAYDTITIQDPIQFAIENSTIEIDTIENIDAGILFDINVQYATIPQTPYIPLDPEEELFVDALIMVNPEEFQTFPAGTNVTITRTDINGQYTWTDLTLPEGEDYVWLSSLLMPVIDNPAYRRTLNQVDGVEETWTISIDQMDYENYDFAVGLFAATNPLGFAEVEFFIAGSLDNTDWLSSPWYLLDMDGVYDIQIPEFTTLALTISTDQVNWSQVDGGFAQQPNNTYIYDGVIDLDVNEEYYYIGVDATANTELIEMNPFYIASYPNPHFLGTGLDDYFETYTFWEYWASRGVYEGCTGTWEPIMWDILIGELPFFYLRAMPGPADTQIFQAIDGLQYAASGGTLLNPLRINGDYFLGECMFEGYIYSAAHDSLEPIDSNGVDELRSELIQIYITLNDEVETTYPTFTELYLQNQVQGSGNWIDLDVLQPRDLQIAFEMYLNSGVDYYDINIKDTSLSNYNLAPKYHPFYLDEVQYPTAFNYYWAAKGVYEDCSGTWEPIMWDIITGVEPMFYLRVDNDQNMMLVDGLQYALDNMPVDEDIYVRVNGDYPLGGYLFTGQFMGINGTFTVENQIGINFIQAPAVKYDLIIHDPATDDPIYEMTTGIGYDMTVNAVDVNDVVVGYHPTVTVLFEANPAAYTSLPPFRRITNGTVRIPQGIVSSQAIPALTLSITDDWFSDAITTLHEGYSVVEPAVVILPPVCAEVFDFDPDQGGFVYFEICRSPNDPFYIPGPSGPAAQPYIDHYTIERYSEPIGSLIYGEGAWEWFESIDVYNNGSNLIVTGPLATVASDDEYEYRVTAVYVPNTDRTEKKATRTRKDSAPVDTGAQSEWLACGEAAAKDNIPAFADIKVYLEGPYAGNGVMIDGTAKPLTSPYNGETIDALPLPNNQIIDWIWIELRQTATGATVKECNAFLLLDGTVVDVAGNSSLPFFYTTNENYYLVIRHRNHIGIMSASTHQFADSPQSTNVIDLSVAGSVWNDGFKQIGTSGIYAMMSGDANGSNLVNAADAIIIMNNWNSTAYNNGDLNLSGLTNSADAIHVLNNLNIAGTVPAQGSDVLTVRTKATGSRAGEDCTLEITNVNVIPGVSYSFDVYITRNPSWSANTALGALFNMFNSTCVFNIQNNAFANPVVTNLGSPISSVIENIYPNKVQVELVSSGLPVPTTPELLFTLTMDIVNPSTTAALSWSSIDTVIYDSSTFAYKTFELLGGDDSALPVVLSSFTANYVAQFDHVALAWSTQSEDGNAGWNLYRGSYENAMMNGEVVLLNQGLIPGAGTTTVPTYYDFIDDYNLSSGSEYWYWLESVDLGGESYLFDPVTLTMPVNATPELPNVTLLKGNYPNPFNPTTEIAYSIMEGEKGVLSIYNAKGQMVHKVELESGHGSYSWKADKQASGVYFYRLQTNSYNSTKKMLLMK